MTFRGLSTWCRETRRKIKFERLEIFADIGYYNNKEIKTCIKNGIILYVARPKINEGKEEFSKKEFKYAKEKDVYICPNGSELSLKKERKEKNG